MRRARRRGSATGAPAEQAALRERHAVLPAIALLAAAAVIAFAVQLYLLWRFTPDEAFVAFRYALNWAAGYGPNFNAGGAHSEGVTSLGYLVILTVAAALGAESVTFAKMFGVECALLTAGLLALLTLEVDRAVGAKIWPALDAKPLAGRAQLAAAFAAAAWLGAFPTAVHAVAGMETLLACVLVTGLVWAILRAHRRAELPGPALGAVAFALGIVRPELCVVAAATWFGAAARTALPAQREAWLRAAVFGWWLPAVAFFVVRAAYYGQLFPISFYTGFRGYEPGPGVANALALGRLLFGGLGLAGSLALIAAPRVTLPILGIALSALLVAVLPDPLKDFDYRYAMPAVPLLLAIAGVGSARLVELLALAIRGERSPGHLLTGLAAVLACVFAASVWIPAATALRERSAYSRALAQTHVRLGRTLAAFLDREQRMPVIALADSGAIPYYSGWHAIDTFSANDPAIAIDGRTDPEYVLDQDPDLVIAVSRNKSPFRIHALYPRDAALYDASRARGFRTATVLTFGPARYLYVMARPDSAIARHLKEVDAKRRRAR